MDWQALLTTLGGTTVLVLAMAWLARTLIEQMFSKDMERFKAEMSAAAARELATLSSSLEIAAARERIRFDVFHQKRAAVVAKLYKHLSSTYQAAKSYAQLMEWSGGPSKEEKYKVLAQRGNALVDYFMAHRIFLSAAMCDQFDQLYMKMKVPTEMMMSELREQQRGSGRPGIDAWSKAWTVMEQDVPPLLRALEDQFRAILEGRESPPATPS